MLSPLLPSLAAAARDTDPLGSPLPPTPRLGGNGNGNGTADRGPAGRRSSKYNGLEVERGSFSARTLSGIGGVRHRQKLRD